MALNKGQDQRNSKQNTDNRQGEKKVYEKKLTVEVEIDGEDRISMMDLLNKVKDVCGRIVGCRYKTPKKYELTMSDERGKDKLMDGMRLKRCIISAKEICNDELVVSFLALPTYIDDEEILDKLAAWGVSAVSPVKRRMWPGTDIADGTRFMKVKFTDKVKSLPYSTRFETLQGTEHFRVIHDRQMKVCRNCIQPGHILRDCPEFTCFKCGEQGHYARECTKHNKCSDCGEEEDRCLCAASAAFRGTRGQELSTENGEDEEEEEILTGDEGEEVTQVPETEREEIQQTEGGESHDTAVTQQEPREATEPGSSMDGAMEEQGLSEGGKIGWRVKTGPPKGPVPQPVHGSTSKEGSPAKSGVPRSGRGRAARASSGAGLNDKQLEVGTSAAAVPESRPASGEVGAGGESRETVEEARKNWCEVFENTSGDDEMEVTREDTNALKRKMEEKGKMKKQVKK